MKETYAWPVIPCSDPILSSVPVSFPFSVTAELLRKGVSFCHQEGKEMKWGNPGSLSCKGEGPGLLVESSLPLAPLPLPLPSQITQRHLHFSMRCTPEPIFSTKHAVLDRTTVPVVTQPKQLQNQGPTSN